MHKPAPITVASASAFAFLGLVQLVQFVLITVGGPQAAGGALTLSVAFALATLVHHKLKDDDS